VAPNKIVVAKVDPAKDPYNAKILEYNVKLLKQVKVDGEPLEVERIEYPMRNGKFWSPYTNTILANNLLLMPVYKSDPPELIRKAIATYKRLLPDHHVDTVDLTTMQKLEGALHCMSINVPNYAKIPRGVLTLQQARALARKKGYVKKTTKPAKPALVNSTPKNKASNSKPAKSSTGELQLSAKSNDAPKLAGSNLSDSNDQSEAPSLFPSEQPKKQKPETSMVSRSQNNVSTVQKRDDSQVAAVMTYRRNFVDASRRFSIDAYAVGFQGRNVVLLETGKTSEVMIELAKLCLEDREWLTKNANKIRANGLKVKNYVNVNGL
jgi:hypothetical protein